MYKAMDTYWTPQQKAEWQARWDAEPEDSFERASLNEMKVEGIYRPKEVSSLPPTPTSTFGTPVASPKPVAALPPRHPPPTTDPKKILSDAKRAAFFKEKRRLTPQEERAIYNEAKAKSKIPQGIATNATRRNVPSLFGGRTNTRKAKKGGEIVTMFFHIRAQVKLYHWQTRSFAEHKATDDLVEALDTNIDKFIEVYMGRYGRPHIKKTLPVKNLSVSGIRAFITKSDEWLASSLPRMLKKTDSDLLNIRDEILADLNQIKYLFTLA
jgi:hypothetical protein